MRSQRSGARAVQRVTAVAPLLLFQLTPLLFFVEGGNFSRPRVDRVDDASISLQLTFIYFTRRAALFLVFVFFKCSSEPPHAVAIHLQLLLAFLFRNHLHRKLSVSVILPEDYRVELCFPHPLDQIRGDLAKSPLLLFA